MNLTDEQLDKVVKFVIVNVVGIIGTLVFVIASVALFGPKIAPLMNSLPW